MKLANSIPTALAALVIALCLPVGIPAQTSTMAPKPQAQKTTAKPVLPGSLKPSAKQAPKPIIASTKPAQKPEAKTAAKPIPAKTTVAKTEPKPTVAKTADAKTAKVSPASTRRTDIKSVGAKPISAKPAIAKVAPSPVAKPPASAVAEKSKPAVGMTSSPDQAPISRADEFVAKRDPFVSLVNVQKEGGGGPNLPPGKAGLVVATVRVDGTVKSGAELIAVVSNPERHVYFVREGDHLYDGSVKRIDLDGVTFQEDSKDAFGKPVVREVTKRIYASAGEQQ